MSHCVPEWGVSAGDMDLPPFAKGKSDGPKQQQQQQQQHQQQHQHQHQKRASFPDMAYVPDYDFEELCWEDGELVVLQGQSSKAQNKGSCSQSQVSSVVPYSENTLMQSPGRTKDRDLRDGMLEAIVHNNNNVKGVSTLAGQEDDFMSWLQIPTEDALEKWFSELLEETPPSSVVYLLHTELVEGSKSSRVDLDPPLYNIVEHGASGNSRYGSNHVQVSTEGCSLVGQPSHMVKQNLILHNSGSSGPCFLSQLTHLQHGGAAAATATSNAMSRLGKASAQQNFLHFSRPNFHLTIPSAIEEEPTLTMQPKRLEKARGGAVSKSDVGGSNVARSLESESICCQPVHRGNGGVVVCSAKMCSTQNSSAIVTVQPDSEAAETLSSAGESHCGSKDKGISSKRKAGVPQDYECPSEDPKKDMDDPKKSLKRSAATKKSRATEVHNLSERRRRDRINEKLKALQELVPNSSKTDKASLLEDAIQHMKMLKAQLQMMYAQMGMAMPQMLISPGMQQLQMAHFPPPFGFAPLFPPPPPPFTMTMGTPRHHKTPHHHKPRCHPKTLP